MDLHTTRTPPSLIVGHRGLPLEYPDNTREGILAATAVCDMVEFDVRRTRDGVAVLSHDPYLGDRAIIEMDWELVAGFDLDGGLHPTRLEDVLRAAGEFPFNLEIKNTPGEPDFDDTFAFAREVASRATGHDVVTSFHWPTVDAVRATFPHLSTGLLVDVHGSLEEAVTRALDSGHRVIAPHWWLLGDQPGAAVSGLVEAGFQIVVWTVNDDEVARNVATGGAAAIITDDPIRIRAAVQGRRQNEHQGRTGRGTQGGDSGEGQSPPRGDS